MAACYDADASMANWGFLPKAEAHRGASGVSTWRIVDVKYAARVDHATWAATGPHGIDTCGATHAAKRYVNNTELAPKHISW
eukprot:COSAG05_NODE_18239_length_311_cov_0.966981_1_plen_81_part_10